MIGGKKKFSLVSFLVFLAVLVLAAFLTFNYLTSAPKKSSDQVEFYISPGEASEKVAQRLKDAGLIRSQLAFRLLLVKDGLTKKIQAGRFLLSSDLSASEIAQKLTHGVLDVWLTIPEGWRAEEIAAEFESKLGIVPADFLKVAKEGQMFPDTYLLPTDITAAKAAEMMLANFEKKFDVALKKEAQKQGLSPDQALVLASIVEREAKFSEDRPIVAGILLKRWQNGMALGADATLQYALGYSQEEKTWWRRNITEEDLKLDSPYNTRKSAGLPPGPICNPGLSAIKAVANPQKTDWWFYLSDKEEKMHYAVTLDEHLQNTQNYL